MKTIIQPKLGMRIIRTTQTRSRVAIEIDGLPVLVDTKSPKMISDNHSYLPVTVKSSGY
jgi:hypothetical protein